LDLNKTPGGIIAIPRDLSVTCFKLCGDGGFILREGEVSLAKLTHRRGIITFGPMDFA
jgi:hypothetical protein